MEIVCAGFGGQGVLTSGLLIAQIALKCGYEVMWSPAYGGEMRGGKAYSLVKYDKEKIMEPDITELDVLVAMNGPSLDFCSQLKSGGLLIVNSDVIDRDEMIPEGFQVFQLPVNHLAQSVHSMKAANLTAVGAVVRLLDLCGKESAEQIIEEYFRSKGKAAYNPVNIAAFRKGYEY